MRIVGDPLKLGRAAAERAFRGSSALLKEALEASFKLIRETYEKALRDALRELEEEFSRAEEYLRSKTASMELELRTRLSELKARFIDEAISRALKEVKREKVGAEWYESYIKATLLKLKSEAQALGGLKLKVAPEDRRLVESIIEAEPELGKLFRIEGEAEGMLGGVVAESADGRVRIDYSLDLVIKAIEPRLRGVASRVLFGD